MSPFLDFKSYLDLMSKKDILFEMPCSNKKIQVH